MQVNYEKALNKRAELKLKKHSNSKIAICNLVFFSLASLFGVGVFICFYKSILGIVLGCIMALSILSIDIFLAKRIRKKFLSENIDYKNNIEKVNKQINEILYGVDKLTKNSLEVLKKESGKYAEE